jgi:hypothetical protein
MGGAMFIKKTGTFLFLVISTILLQCMLSAASASQASTTTKQTGVAVSLKRLVALMVASCATATKAHPQKDFLLGTPPEAIADYMLTAKEFVFPTLSSEQISVAMPFEQGYDATRCPAVEGKSSTMNQLHVRQSFYGSCSGLLECPQSVSGEPARYCFADISCKPNDAFRQLMATEPCEKVSHIARAHQLRCIAADLWQSAKASSLAKYPHHAITAIERARQVLFQESSVGTPIEHPDISQNNHGDVTLVTIATPNRALFADTTERNQRAYAYRHGYNFAKFTRTLDASRPEEWSKIKALYNVLRNPDFAQSKWLLWIDDDIMITNPTINLESFIAEHAGEDTQIIIAQDAYSHRGVPINNGIFLIRNSDWSKDFLRRVWIAGADKRYLTRGTSLLEQQTMTYLLDGEPERVAILPTRAMNSFLRDRSYHDSDDKVWAPGDFAAHATGMPAELRTCIIKSLDEDASQASCAILTTCDKTDRRVCDKKSETSARALWLWIRSIL